MKNITKLIELIREGKNSEAKEMVDTILTEKLLISTEAQKVVIKVNSLGQRKKKLKCGPGKKLKDGRCVLQKSSEKLARKKGLRKAVKSKKAAGAGARARTTKKRNKALKKRKSQGL